MEAEDTYLVGYEAAWRSILREAVSQLGMAPLPQGWSTERLAVIALLREVCALHGDNEWEDTLHLVDIIDKHLWKHLEAKNTLV